MDPNSFYFARIHRTQGSIGAIVCDYLLIFDKSKSQEEIILDQTPLVKFKVVVLSLNISLIAEPINLLWR